MNLEKHIYELPLEIILPNRFQPRITFDDKQIYELSESIKQNGVFSPIIVRKLGDKYEIIAGERRYKASLMAGKTTIPAIISSATDDETIKIALLENIQRSNLSPIEEAISYKKISDMGNISQDRLAKMLGKTQATVANKLRLLKLSEEVQESLMENKISERHARSLLRIKNEEDQNKMLNRIINERLTVRKLDDEIDKLFNNNEGLEFIEIDDSSMNIDIPNDQQTVKNVTVEEPKIMDFNNEQPNRFFNYNTSEMVNETIQENKSNNPQSFMSEDILTSNNESTNQENNIFNFTPINNIEPNKIEPEEIKNNFFDDIENIQVLDEPKEDEYNLIDNKVDNNNESKSVFNIEGIKIDEITTSEIIDETNIKIPSINMEINSKSTQEVENNTIQSNKNYDEAVKKIRDTVNLLKSSGYRIEYDEFNLETMFQLNIRIEK